MLEIGRTENEVKHGISLLQKAYEKGTAKSLVVISLIYEHGLGVPKCGERAKWWLKLFSDGFEHQPARAQGEADFEITRGRREERLASAAATIDDAAFIVEGIFGPAKTTVNPSMRRLAEGGDAEAMYLVGCKLIDSSPEEAKEFLLKAAGQGLPLARHELARNLFEKADTGADAAEVVSLLAAGADVGFGRSAGFLSTMFHVGEGVGKDPEKATEWAAKAHPADLEKARSEFAYNNLRRTLRRARSCPEAWCKSCGGIAFSGRAGRCRQAAGTADSMTMGSSLTGAMVSRLM